MARAARRGRVRRDRRAPHRDRRARVAAPRFAPHPRLRRQRDRRRVVSLRLRVVRGHRRARVLLRRGRAVVGRVLPGVPARRATTRSRDRQHPARTHRRHVDRWARRARAVRALVRAETRTWRSAARGRVLRALPVCLVPLRRGVRRRSVPRLCDRCLRPARARPSGARRSRGCRGGGDAADRHCRRGRFARPRDRATRWAPHARGERGPVARRTARDPGAARRPGAPPATSVCCSRPRA